MADNRFTVQFLGAAETVTGSKHLVTFRDKTYLLDCGQFQGLKDLRERNRLAFAFDPRKLHCVVLSHAHLDHSGLLPLLVRQGFTGPIHCTAATADLLKLVLLDAAKIQEEDANQANKHGWSRHKPAVPLFTTLDAENTFKLVKTHDFSGPFEIDNEVNVTYRRTGHILGSASIDISMGATNPSRLVFSGDLGRWNKPILRDPEAVPAADMLLIEGTYGDRMHSAKPEEQLQRIINETADRQGVLLVPAFAIDRAQELLFLIRKLEDEGKIPAIPVWLDSPMAVEATEIYLKNMGEHDIETSKLTDAGRNPIRSKHQRFARSPDESKAINKMPGPMIIIASSGMATAGRILHHMAQRIGSPKTTIALVGFQAEGTRGRDLRRGATSIRIHGESYPVKARIESLDGLSAHADQGELLRWMKGFSKPPKMTYIVHAEERPASVLVQEIKKLGWNAEVAKDRQVAFAGG